MGLDIFSASAATANSQIVADHKRDLVARFTEFLETAIKPLLGDLGTAEQAAETLRKFEDRYCSRPINFGASGVTDADGTQRIWITLNPKRANLLDPHAVMGWSEGMTTALSHEANRCVKGVNPEWNASVIAQQDSSELPTLLLTRRLPQ